MGMSSFFAGGVGDDVQTWEGRGTNLGLGMFVLVMISMYTANLTTILVSSATKTPLSGIDEAIAKNVEICVLSTYSAIIKDTYPSANLEVMHSRDGIIDAIDDGRCEAGLMYLEDLEEVHFEGNYCELVQVGLPIVEVHRGFPINPLKAKELSYHF